MKLTRAWKIAAAVAAIAVLAALGGAVWLSNNRPQPLGLASAHPRTPAPSPAANDPFAAVCRQPAVPAGSSASGVSGVWVIQPGSVVGYRASERFAEVRGPHEAVARTDRVLGWLLVADSSGSVSIETGCVAVLLDGLRSVDELPGFDTRDRDKSARDFLRTHTNPYAVFQPYPSAVTQTVQKDHEIRVKVSGLFEVNGVSRPATFDLKVLLSEAEAAAAGSTAVNVEDYGIDVPQAAGGFVAVDPRITLEVSLVLVRP